MCALPSVSPIPKAYVWDAITAPVTGSSWVRAFCPTRHPMEGAGGAGAAASSRSCSGRTRTATLMCAAVVGAAAAAAAEPKGNAAACVAKGVVEEDMCTLSMADPCQQCAAIRVSRPEVLSNPNQRGSACPFFPLAPSPCLVSLSCLALPCATPPPFFFLRCHAPSLLTRAAAQLRPTLRQHRPHVAVGARAGCYRECSDR